jgi:hypothetical protein
MPRVTGSSVLGTPSPTHCYGVVPSSHSYTINLHLLTSINYRADDLIPEESENVLLALKRLPPKEAYDRVFRLRRAFQVQHSYSELDFHSEKDASNFDRLRSPTNSFQRSNTQSQKR